MTPDTLLQNVAVIIEETAHGVRDRVSGDMPPLTADELDTISDRVMLLCAKNKPRLETT